MFDFLKKKKTSPEETQTIESVQSETTTPAQPEAITPAQPETTNKVGLFSRLKAGLAKTRASFSAGLGRLFLGKKELNAELIAEIETQLLTADVGVETTQQLINTLTKKLARKELNDTHAAFQCLLSEMRQILKPSETPLIIPKDQKPFVILMVGINGSGKTTTIGKMAHLFTQQNKSVLLAAGDTFRAAAVQQLSAWGERNRVPVIAQQPGADTAAVIYDAFEAARARQVDILIADTAGRLHTQSNLMNELQKVKRVLGKIDANAPHEILIVLDAGVGQNALNQVKEFNQALGVTGIVLTKLDGTAKGGIIFAIAQQTGIPIRYIGIGEGIEDLRPFKSDEFVDALFTESEETS